MTSTLSLKRALLISCLSLTGMLGASATVMAASPGEQSLKNHTIAYATYFNQWAVYQTPDGKEECPQGMGVMGPRERFKALFPDDGTKRTVKDTHLALEGSRWNPKPSPDKFPYALAGGTISYGMNLDGKVGPNDFTSPDGEKGIDNQLFRVIGCNGNLRGPAGPIYAIGENYFRNATFNRILIELTNVDNLVNDPEVNVTITRGLDTLITDAGGDHMLPGGTQRVDTRWTKKFEQHLKGKIVDGVLTTAPAAVVRILDGRNRKPVEELFRDGRFQLKLTPDYADGILAGYVDIDRFYFGYNREFQEHDLEDGPENSHAEYQKLIELADAYPDPKTGTNTAISGAMLVKFVQTFVVRPGKVVSSYAADTKHAEAFSKTAPVVPKTGER